MKRQTVTIVNQLGLHARAASKLVNTASRFQSEVWLEKDGKRVNGKSIMGVLMLAASIGSELLLETAGEDEQQALDVLSQLIDNRFGEDA